LQNLAKIIISYLRKGRESKAYREVLLRETLAPQVHKGGMQPLLVRRLDL
jgi:hypothetical protein